MCLLITPAGIRGIASSLLPNRHCAGTKRGEPAATGSEVQHPKSLRAPRRGEGGRPCFRISSSGTLPQTGRVWGYSQREYGAMNAKKRVRKVPSVPDLHRQQTFRTLKQVLVFFLMAVRRSQHLRCSTTASKEKTADEHGSLVVHRNGDNSRRALPWRKTAEAYKPNSVRNARCPTRSQVNPAPEFHRVRAKNQ